MTILYCESHPTLKLGPGRLEEKQSIQFVRGFARVELDDPDYVEKMRWVSAVGTPPIENLGEDDQGIADSETPGHPCGVCGRRFKNDFSLKGHLRSHAPKAERKAVTV